MPYYVSGWVEYRWQAPGERELSGASWVPLLSLDPFFLRGDEISNYLFGLAKDPNERAPFKDRGLPSDCCAVVRSEHDESDFGHTYATWTEVVRALAETGAPKPEDDCIGDWKPV